MNFFSALDRIVNLRSLLMGAATVCAGMGAVGMVAVSDIFPFILCLFFAALAQMWAHFAHCLADVNNEYGIMHDSTYYDFKKANLPDLEVLCKAGTTAMAILTLTVGMGMVMISGWPAVAIGVAIFLLGYFDNYGPKPLYRTWFAPVLAACAFGILGVLGTAIVLEGYTEHITLDRGQWLPVILVGIAFGATAMNVQLLRDFAFAAEDRRLNKKTFTVKFGNTVTRLILLLNGLICAGALGYIPLYVYGHPHWAWLVPAIYVLVANLVIVLLTWSKSASIRYRLSQIGLYAQFTFGIILMICYIGHRV